MELGDDVVALEGEGGACANSAAAADDGDFHRALTNVSNVRRVLGRNPHPNPLPVYQERGQEGISYTVAMIWSVITCTSCSISSSLKLSGAREAMARSM